MNHTLSSIILNGFVFLFTSASLFSQEEKAWMPDPATVERLSKNQPGINYYEDRVPQYTLPEILMSDDGRKVNTSAEWEQLRRSEILELFRQNVFGRVPDSPYSIDFHLVSENKIAIDGTATLRQVDITITREGKSLVIHLNLFIPNSAVKPVPAFLLINNRGSQVADPLRTVKSEFWPAEKIIERGYAAAVFNNSDIDPDDYDEFRNGIHGLLDSGVRNQDSWGTIAAWAWGAGRCMDYLEKDKAINSKKVAVVGHSRGGKTALWAAACDQRFAMAVSNESGCGGAALARRKYGETIARINKAFPHWFCSNYVQWSDNENSMPVDMHMLVALIAPRAVYITSASEDLWADPRGSYLSLFHSLPVFRLYDEHTDLPETMPPLNKPVISGKLAYHIRDGEHNLLLRDWNWFMDFADRVLK
jgi:pimeloyl-ACP methyl ester carboxylesterase